MKKLYTLFACALLSSPSVFAQRLVDLEVTVVTPATNATITSGTQFSTRFIVKNVGTTTLKTSDSVIYAYTLDGAGLDLTGSGQTTVYFRTGKQLAQNDTIIVDRNLTFTFPASLNGPHQFGALATILNTSVDSAIDNMTSNNTDTNTVIFGSGTTAVNELQASLVNNGVLSAYPNPASDNLNLKVKLDATSNVIVRIVDITGKVIYVENKGTIMKGEHVFNILLKGMTQGYYFYQVVIDNETFSDKVFIKG